VTELLKISALLAVTALAEIVGCYLPWLILKQGRSAKLVIPAAEEGFQVFVRRFRHG
jgi:small multidrug resistance family-3 protein